MKIKIGQKLKRNFGNESVVEIKKILDDQIVIAEGDMIHYIDNDKVKRFFKPLDDKSDDDHLTTNI
jgi:predicted class III extradiol MEMO1 family dioxygenase